MKVLIVVALLALAGTQAYRHWPASFDISGGQIGKARALAVLRKVENIQGMYWNDHGRFAASLGELGTFSGGKDSWLAPLLAARKAGRSYDGFLFHEVTRPAAGGDILYGLLAIPEGGGDADGYAILIDMSKLKVDAEGRSSGGIGALYRFPAAQAGDTGRWPSEATLAKWEVLERLSPQDTLTKAGGMAGSARPLRED